MIPQWYFWLLLSFSVLAIFVLLATFIKYKKNRKKDIDAMEEKKERANAKDRRKTFTLRRTPYARVNALDIEAGAAAPGESTEGAGYVLGSSNTDETPGGTTIMWPVSIELKKLARAADSSESDDQKGNTSRTPKNVHLKKKGNSTGSDTQSPAESPRSSQPETSGAKKWKTKMPNIA